MTPITARHTRDRDGNPLIEIRVVGTKIALDAELSPNELRELARQLVAIASSADQGAIGRRVYPEETT